MMRWRGLFADGSWRSVVGGWAWFYLVLFSYYCLKPLRDGLGTQFAGRMEGLYFATFIATLAAYLVYSPLVARLPRRWLVFSVHQLFVLQMLWFYVELQRSEEPPDWLVAIFFVWVSVFNLYVVTLFWSVMADVFRQEQGKRWFGTMAAAGSLGSLSASIVVWHVSARVGIGNLLWLAAAFLELAVWVAWQVDRRYAARTWNEVAPIPEVGGTGGGLWSALASVARSPYLMGICLFVALGKFGATFIYNFLQAQLAAEMPDISARTSLFSQMNLWSQLGSLLTQGIVAAWLLRTVGLRWTLAIPGILLMALLAGIAQWPSLNWIVATQVIQQILGYGLLVPAQHVLFTVVPREDKYKSKALIENVVFRGSDSLSSRFCDALLKRGVALGPAAWIMIPILLVWVAVGYMLGGARKLSESGPIHRWQET